jgi:predicted ATPase
MSASSTLRFAFIGAPGVGKTTLARLLAEKLELPLISERARRVAADWGATPATVPQKDLRDFQWTILRSQVAAEESCRGGFVSDRCVIDTIAHTIAFAFPMGMEDSHLRRFTEAAAVRLDTYDVVVFVPPMFPIENDGERIATEEFQHDLHVLFSRVVEDLDRDYCPGLKDRVLTISTLSIDDRLDEIMQAMARAMPATALKERS